MTTSGRIREAVQWTARIHALTGGTAGRLRIIGVVLAAATIGLSVLIVWNLNQRSLLVATGQIRNLDLALAEQINRYFQVIDLMLQRVQLHVDTLGIETPGAFRERMDDGEAHGYMAGLTANLPPDHAISLFSTDGRSLANSATIVTTPYSVEDRYYFRYLRDHADPGVVIEVVDAARRTGRASVVLGRRISAADGAFLGVAVMTAPVRYLLNFYDVLNKQQPVAVNLLRRDGQVLMRYPVVEEGPTSMPPASPWYRVVAEGGGTYRSPGDLG